MCYVRQNIWIPRIDSIKDMHIPSDDMQPCMKGIQQSVTRVTIRHSSVCRNEQTDKVISDELLDILFA